MYKKMFLSIVVLSLCLVFISIELAYSQGSVKAGEENITPLALTGGGGWLEKAKFWAETNELSNSDNSTWVDVFNVTVKLKDTELPTQCIAITYSGEFGMTGATLSQAQLRVLVDGNPAEGQGAIGYTYILSPQFDYYTSFGHSWWKCGLSAGGDSHIVQVQLRPDYSGDTTYVRQRTLIIEYKR